MQLFTKLPRHLYYHHFIDWRYLTIQDLQERVKDTRSDNSPPDPNIKPIYSLGDFVSDFNLMLYNALVFRRSVIKKCNADTAKDIPQHLLEGTKPAVKQLLREFNQRILEVFNFDVKKFYRKMGVDGVLTCQYYKKKKKN